MTLTGTTAPGQSEPGSNDNQGVLHNPQSSKTGASPSDIIQCPSQDTYFLMGLISLHAVEWAYSKLHPRKNEFCEK